MGLNINLDRSVVFDDTHQKRVNTSIQDNPSKERIGGVELHFVFRRNRNGDLDRDGSPLIYALKGMNGYSIVPMYRKMFMNRAEQIVKSVASEIEVDFVMPIPSSYKFCGDFSELVSGWLNKECVSSDFIEKQSIGQILDGELMNPDEITNRRTRTLYASQLAAWKKMDRGRHISMKELDPKIRPFFQPLTIVGTLPEKLAGARVLLVDDLMSTGTSVLSASKLLSDSGVAACSGICFLSGLR